MSNFCIPNSIDIQIESKFKLKRKVNYTPTYLILTSIYNVSPLEHLMLVDISIHGHLLPFCQYNYLLENFSPLQIFKLVFSNSMCPIDTYINILNKYIYFKNIILVLNPSAENRTFKLIYMLFRVFINYNYADFDITFLVDSLKYLIKVHNDLINEQFMEKETTESDLLKDSALIDIIENQISSIPKDSMNSNKECNNKIMFETCTNSTVSYSFIMQLIRLQTYNGNVFLHNFVMKLLQKAYFELLKQEEKKKRLEEFNLVSEILMTQINENIQEEEETKHLSKRRKL